MKLKTKNRHKKYDDSWQKCCRYCHHYYQGSCMCDEAVGYLSDEKAGHDEWFNHACEEGKVQEALKETLEEEKTYSDFFTDLENLAVRCGVGKKKLEEFKKGVQDCYDIFVGDALPRLDGRLNDALDSWELFWGDYEGSRQIIDPLNHVCKYWE